MISFKEKILQIKKNQSSGSSQLLQEIINTLTTNKASDHDLLWSFSTLGEIDPSMRLIHHFLEELKPAIGYDFNNQIQEYIFRWENVNEKIVKNLLNSLPNRSLTILTHSHSGVVIEVIMLMLKYGYSIEIIQTESHPGGEGFIQAKALHQLGVAVTIIKDNTIIDHIGTVNCCFFGVDQYDEKSFVNKVGSNNIVEMADKANVPVFVLGDTRKKVNKVKLDNLELFEIIPFLGNLRIITPKG